MNMIFVVCSNLFLNFINKSDLYKKELKAMIYVNK